MAVSPVPMRHGVDEIRCFVSSRMAWTFGIFNLHGLSRALAFTLRGDTSFRRSERAAV